LPKQIITGAKNSFIKDDFRQVSNNLPFFIPVIIEGAAYQKHFPVHPELVEGQAVHGSILRQAQDFTTNGTVGTTNMLVL